MMSLPGAGAATVGPVINLAKAFTDLKMIFCRMREVALQTATTAVPYRSFRNGDPFLR
jgi:hypothetical protein